MRTLAVSLSYLALLLFAGTATAVGTTGSASGISSEATTSVTTSAPAPSSAAAGSTAVLGRSTLTRTSSARGEERVAGLELSTPAIALAALAAALVLLSLAWALIRAFAYEPSWMPSLRHSFAEAGFRISATWAELWDWLRLGR
jgi:hypothetical protein